MRLRFQMKTGELSDHSRFNITKRKIARMLTVLNERAAAESKGE
jgi:ribosomal protein L29